MASEVAHSSAVARNVNDTVNGINHWPCVVRGQSKPKPSQVINRSRYWRGLTIVVGSDGIVGPVIALARCWLALLALRPPVMAEFANLSLITCFV